MAGRLAGLGALLVACLFAGPVAADEIDRYIAQEQRLYGVPSIVVGIYREGELVDQRAVGVVNVELGVPAETKHAFEIGSISKQFTAWAILMLRDEGRLALDAPVGRYLPDLPAAWAAPTLHRLLTHTSGLPDLEDAFTYGVYRETPPDAEFQRRLLTLPIDFPPGDRWAYSNTNYWLLARVIEKISGLSYADFMRERLFTPLGMASTRSALPSQPLTNRASGYERKAGRLENRDAIQPNTGRGLGDIVTTVADMARWEREQLSPRLVSHESVELARSPVVLNDGKTAPYGYGWQTDRILPRPTIHHTGQTAGFTSMYLRVPERREAVVVLTNMYDGPVGSLAEHIIGAVDPSTKWPNASPIAETDDVLAARVRQLLDTAGSAEIDWSEDWFTAARWTEIKDSRADRSTFYQRLGPVIGITRESVDPTSEARTAAYRVVYASVTRLLTIRTDENGRIAENWARDE